MKSLLSHPVIFLGWICAFPIASHAAQPSKVVTFSDEVRRLSLQTGQPAYRVSFNLHAAVYELPARDKALQCLLDSFRRRTSVKISVNPITLRILACKT